MKKYDNDTVMLSSIGVYGRLLAWLANQAVDQLRTTALITHGCSYSFVKRRKRVKENNVHVCVCARNAKAHQYVFIFFFSS